MREGIGSARFANVCFGRFSIEAPSTLRSRIAPPKQAFDGHISAHRQTHRSPHCDVVRSTFTDPFVIGRTQTLWCDWTIQACMTDMSTTTLQLCLVTTCAELTKQFCRGDIHLTVVTTNIVLSPSQGSMPTGSDLVSNKTSISLMQWNSEVDLARVAVLGAHEKSNVSRVVVSTGCYQARSGAQCPRCPALCAPARTACHPRARRSESTSNNVRIEPVPQNLRAPRMSPCTPVIGWRALYERVPHRLWAT